MIEINKNSMVMASLDLQPELCSLMADRINDMATNELANRINHEISKKLTITKTIEQDRTIFSTEVYVFSKDEMKQLIEEIKQAVKDGRY